MSKNYNDLTDKQLEKENQRLDRDISAAREEKVKIVAIRDKRAQDERIKQALESAGIEADSNILDVVAAKVGA